MTSQQASEVSRADTVSALERGVKLLHCFNAQTLSLSAAELASLTAYTSKFGLPNACRLIVNLNEFTFID